MPPASPETTFALRIASSSEVLPWSTWPMIVTIGGRDCRSSALSSTVSITCSTSASETRTARWPNSSMISSAVSASMVWFMLTSMPIFIRAFTTSAARSAMRFASSDTTMVSGNCTSRACFSGFWPKPSALLRAFSCLRFIEASERVRPPSPSSAAVRVNLPARRPSSPLLFEARSRSRSSRSRSVLRGLEVAAPVLAPPPRVSSPAAGAGATAGASFAFGAAAAAA